MTGSTTLVGGLVFSRRGTGIAMDQGLVGDPAELAAVEVSRLLARAEGLRRLVELARQEAAKMAVIDSAGQLGLPLLKRHECSAWGERRVLSPANNP